MFDVGFNELLLIAVIGLLVLGPERLPKVAAQIGRWVARARRTAAQLRQELEREIALSEIAKAEKRGQEKRQASSTDDKDSEHEAVASDYEADLYTTTHEGLGAESAARPNGHDGAEQATPKHTAPQRAGESEHSDAPPPEPKVESQPPQAETDTRPAAPQQAAAARSAGEEPTDSTKKTPNG